MTSKILTTATTDSACRLVQRGRIDVHYVIPALAAGYTYTVKPHPPTPRDGQEPK
jgi:hypothetical protein